MKKTLYTVYMSCIICIGTKAQDPMYTQTFMAPVYLNPAATGMADYDLRISAVYRRQWLLVPSGMQYATLAADKFIYNNNAGIGVMINSEREGYINRTGAYGTLSKLLCFGSHQLSLGIQAGRYNRRVDYSKLWFADQISSEGIITNLPSQVAPNINNKKWLWDFAAGAMWMHNSGVMVGGSVHHLTRPDESFTNMEESKLPRRLTLTTRYPLIIGQSIWDDDVFCIPGAVYSMQRKNKTLSLGCEFKTHYFNFGLWYRNNLGLRSSDAVAFTITLDNLLELGSNESRSKLRGGVAYDFTTNGAGSTRTAGSTEGAILWEHLLNEEATSDNRCNAMGRGGLPCPPDVYRRAF